MTVKELVINSLTKMAIRHDKIYAAHSDKDWGILAGLEAANLNIVINLLKGDLDEILEDEPSAIVPGPKVYIN